MELSMTNSIFPENEIFQVATFSSLKRGVYDADYSYADLFKKGNLGLGTFESVDGEMVALDGEFFHIGDTGALTKVTPDQVAPFAEVVHFVPKHFETLKEINSFDALSTCIEGLLINKNVPHILRLDGTYHSLKVRSLRKQNKPYPPLQIATKTQAVFDLEEEVKGSLVGFWFPQYWADIGVPGVHLHFAADDRTVGGHLLEISIKEVELSFAASQNFSLYMPNLSSFSEADLLSRS
jgi:acetolactate decarboxylase